MTNRTGAPGLRPRGFWNPAAVQNVPPPPSYAVPCPPGKHCVENLLERTAACGDGCRRRPPQPLAERGPCGSGSFLPAGSQTPLRGPAPPLPAGSPVSSRSRDPALSPGGLGRGSAPPSRRRRPPRRSPPLAPVCPADAPSRRDTCCRRAAREGLLATLPPAGGEIPPFPHPLRAQAPGAGTNPPPPPRHAGG